MLEKIFTKVKYLITTIIKKIICFLLSILCGMGSWFFFAKVGAICDKHELGMAGGHLNSIKALPYLPVLGIFAMLGGILLIVCICFFVNAIPFSGLFFKDKDKDNKEAKNKEVEQYKETKTDQESEAD